MAYLNVLHKSKHMVFIQKKAARNENWMTNPVEIQTEYSVVIDELMNSTNRWSIISYGIQL